MTTKQFTGTDAETMAAAMCQETMRGAVAWIQAHNKVLAPGDATDRLMAALRRNVKERQDAAFRDAKQALDAGMTEAAVATFGLSMRLAGVDAAKEVLS